MIQTGVGIAALIAGIIIATIFVVVARSARISEDYKTVSGKGYALRAKYFKTLIAFSVIICTITFMYMPYPRFAKGRVVGDIKVYKVMASQFSFEILDEDGNDVEQIPAGAIRFDVTSDDVNHGFGVYTEEGNIIGNVQMMPDYINSLYMQIDEPGMYTVWCMEYCGVAHHDMKAEFEVI